MDDRFRTSAADRDRVAALLRDHFAAGRLSRVPPEAGRLERRYRRLLLFYPARYRRVHEEEMLAVLMTAAPAGKRRPGITEAADLIWGALRVRFQPQRDGTGPAWRDALAVLSVILPVIMLVIFAVQETRNSLSAPLWVLEQIATPFALVALVLLRWRRLATLAAGAIFLWVAFLSGGSTYVYATSDAYLFVPLGLEIVALAASPGPRRGLQILTWKHSALVVIATLTVATTSYPVTLIVIAAIGIAMVLAPSLGRWLLVLLVIAAWPFFVYLPLLIPVELSLPYGLGFIGQAYLLPAALLAVFAMAAHRESRRSSDGKGDYGAVVYSSKRG